MGMVNLCGPAGSALPEDILDIQIITNPTLISGSYNIPVSYTADYRIIQAIAFYGSTVVSTSLGLRATENIAGGSTYLRWHNAWQVYDSFLTTSSYNKSTTTSPTAAKLNIPAGGYPSLTKIIVFYYK